MNIPILGQSGQAPKSQIGAGTNGADIIFVGLVYDGGLHEHRHAMTVEGAEEFLAVLKSKIDEAKAVRAAVRGNGAGTIHIR